MNDTARTSEGADGTSSTAPFATADETPPAIHATGEPLGQRAFRERRRGRGPWLLAGVTLAFLGGIAAAIIAYPRISGWWNGADTAQTLAPPAPVSTRANQDDAQPLNAARQDLLGVRMTELEDRLARISVAAPRTRKWC